MTELIVIMVVALIVIGPKRLPELARTLGKALGDFKRATSDFQNSFSMEDDYDLDVLDEEGKEKEKKAGAEESDEDDEGEEEEDDAAEQTAEPDQTETDDLPPEAGDAAPEAEDAATESEAAEDKTGAAREDDKQT
ncbi:MAG: twin-arginine translocase TatA/TatE family subunit [Nitrospinae bacterium]|nr:twin-arginine translocase TatA/TatE family subunit [Nitrospinota bacterium]